MRVQGNVESKRLCRGSWAAIRLLRCLNMSYAYYDTAFDQTLSSSLLTGAYVYAYVYVYIHVCVCVRACVCVHLNECVW